ncbi:hypothetical protein PT286_04290 [Neisseriaceae bacterium ESL0693]|nr:hypothetical protein [Neisseriaceae bacterium ESL0693]
MGYQLPNDDTCYQTMQDAENAFLVKLPTMTDVHGNTIAFSRKNHLEFNNTQMHLQLQTCETNTADLYSRALTDLGLLSLSIMVLIMWFQIKK